VHVAQFTLRSYGAGNLEVGETIYLGLTQQFSVERVDVAVFQPLIDVDDMLQLIEEPRSIFVKSWI
jgi:hypothetical protein